MKKQTLIDWIIKRTVNLHGMDIISVNNLLEFIDRECVDVINEYEEEIFCESGEIFKRA
jgi:hypothetical protein